MRFNYIYNLTYSSPFAKGLKVERGKRDALLG